MRALQRLVAHLGRPALRIGDEEALVAGEAVDHRRFLAAQAGAVGLVGRLQAGDVGDILAQRQLAVDVQAGERLVSVILLGQRVAGLLELG